MELQLQSLLGLVAIPLLAYLMSEDRAALKPLRILRLITVGIALQVAIAGVMLNVEPLRLVFDWLAGLVASLQAATNEGTKVVFGYLAGGDPPFEVRHPKNGFILALQALPLILLVSALSRLLYHWGILQAVVKAFAFVLRRALGISGPVGTSAAANIFVGMVEAPLLIRPYLANMSRGALFATMTVGMATVAGTVLALYASLISSGLPGAAGHLIVASVISAPAALMLAFLMVPDDAQSAGADQDAEVVLEDAPRSSIDAVTQGTREGIVLLANVTALLIVFIALVALVNQLLGLAASPFGVELRIERILGWLFSPLAWLAGIPWSEALTAGELLGIKTTLNEFVAYLRLAGIAEDALSDRSRLILTYALCGFANFGSLGIMIGGLTAMAPERRADIVGLGMKTMVSGTLATLMTGAIVGLMTSP